MWYDHRPNEVIEDLDSCLVSSAVVTFTLMLASFTFQMAAAAPGITSRCRNNRDRKTSTLLVSSPEWGNPSQKLPTDLPSGLLSRLWVRRPLLNQRHGKGMETPYWLINQDLLLNGQWSWFSLSADYLNKIGVLWARKKEGMVVGEVPLRGAHRHQACLSSVSGTTLRTV